MHDRAIVVHLSAAEVRVDYRLEVDEFTVLFDDLPPFQDQIDKDKEHPYATFTRCYAPALADNLLAKVDGKPLKFECVKRGHRLEDEEGKPLGHLRCDFVFRAAWPVVDNSSKPRQFTLKETSYQGEAGKIVLSLVADSSVKIFDKVEPDPALQDRPEAERRPGDEAKLRQVAATFTVGHVSNVPPQTVEVGHVGNVPPQEGNSSGSNKLLGLLLDTRRGFAVLLLLAACFGAVHALTPGHGKTLVAAYLIAERGTVWHALVLGLVTTLAHTGAVLILAVVLNFMYKDKAPADLESVLAVAGGLLVAGLGFWLLLRRLAGQTDHVHLGHSHHHHHHDHNHADHVHDEHGHAIPVSPGAVGWWGTIVLGVSGGILPCWDAIAIFGFAVSSGRLGLAVPLLVAFSAGLAAVLVVIGVLVVYAKGFAGSHFGESRLVRALPILSAAIVMVAGLWQCFTVLHK